ncbi:sigma-70 family RNA polymerase sigma factor [Mumia sp. DW29H23]|uniref:sigma-70 family RNA polymerase sigma factor n=1 Tax=Mumia sp. DW29H23 TaxID=3421241 RepID=UPI003D68259A
MPSTFAPSALRTSLDPLRALTGTPLLDADEEHRLAEAYAAGRRAAQRLEAEGAEGPERARLAELVETGLRARSHLILANVRLVVAFARRHQDRGVPVVDLVQEGVVGLIAAVDGYDPARGTRFSSYAVAWIRRHVADAVSTRRAVRLPPKAERDVVVCRDAADSLVRELGRAPSTAAIAARTGFVTVHVERLLAADAPVVSLDAAGVEEGIAGGSGPRDHRAEEGVRAALSTLPDADRDVVERRFGLDGGGPRSARRVADELGRTPAWVRATERRALRTLRAHPAVSVLGA